MPKTINTLFLKLEDLIESLDEKTISDERKVILQALLDYIQDKVTKGKEVKINFISTHNSRRSHLSQVWAQALAAHFGIRNVYYT